jgi:hypothetical protein
MDIVLSSKPQRSGFIAQEAFGLQEILSNRFGEYYEHGGSNQLSANLIARGETGRQRRKRAETE